MKHVTEGPWGMYYRPDFNPDNFPVFDTFCDSAFFASVTASPVLAPSGRHSPEGLA